MEHQNNTNKWIKDVSGGCIFSVASELKNQNVLNYFYSLVQSQLPDNHLLLNWAIKLNQVSEVERLCHSLNVDVNQPLPPQDNTPLFCAALLNNEEVVQWLLDNNALVNQRSNGCPVLYAAARNGSINIVRKLLERGAEVDLATSGEEKQTAMYGAADKGHLEVMKILVENGADLKYKLPKLGTYLQMAVSNGHVDCARFLLQRCLSLCYLPDDDGKMPLFRAVCKKQYHAAKLLIEEFDVKIDYGIPPGGFTTLHAAAHLGCDNIIKLLIEHGADVNAVAVDQQERGATPLHVAVPSAGPSTVILLLKHGANPSHGFADRNPFEVFSQAGVLAGNVALLGLYEIIAVASNYEDRTDYNAAVALRDVVVFGADPSILAQHSAILNDIDGDIGLIYCMLLEAKLVPEPGPAPAPRLAP